MAKPVRNPTFERKKISITETKAMRRNWRITIPGLVRPAPLMGFLIGG
jgi:hypothetical protein